jgi:hypothetical protein
MSFLVGLALGLGGLIYYYQQKEPLPAPTEEQVEQKLKYEGYVPPPSPPPLPTAGNATIAASVRSEPYGYVPVADVDRSLYEAQIKHLNMSSRFVHG